MKKFFDSKLPARNTEKDTKAWSIGTGLAHYRSENGLTQGAMADLMGVSIRSYQGYERGEHDVPFSSIETLAQSTDIDLSFLLTGKFPQPSSTALENWARQLFTANQYVRETAPDLAPEKQMEIIVAYFKLDASSAEFTPERIDPLIAMFKG